MPVEDVFVWSPEVIRNKIEDVIRVNYYTSATGDDLKINGLKDQLSAIQFSCRSDQIRKIGYTFPRIFKKPRRKAKSRGVDINITIDALVHAQNDSMDIACLSPDNRGLYNVIQRVPVCLLPA